MPVLGVAGVLAGSLFLMAPDVDPYVDAVAPATTAMIVDGDNVIGAPDGRVATVNGRFGARVVLDLGAGEDGVGNVEVSYFGHTLALQTQLDFLDASGGVVASKALTMIGLGSHVVTVVNGSTKPYRYISIRAGQTQVFGLDAIKTAAL